MRWLLYVLAAPFALLVIVGLIVFWLFISLLLAVEDIVCAAFRTLFRA